MRLLQISTLAAYTLLLSAWSAAICYGASGALAAAIGAVPVVGWAYAVIRFGILGTPFGLMSVFWLFAAAAVWMAGRAPDRGR